MKPAFETVQLEDHSSIRVLHFQCEQFQDDHGWHYHPEYELSYIIQGEGTRFIGDSIENYTTGDLVIVGPDIPHCWTTGENKSGKACEMIAIQFPENCLGESFNQIPEARHFMSFLKKTHKGVCFSPASSSKYHEKLLAISKASGLQLISLFLELFDLLSTTDEFKFLISENYINDNQLAQDERMKKIITYISENLSADIKQSDLAELLDMTPQSFSRFFKTNTGRTFVSFVNMMRIAQACKLLTNSEKDILGISLDCGYSNLSNFNRRFAELKNITPSQYRAQYKKLKQRAMTS
jgi:AraC-like DNA-binding protein/mannose-6-phosphate isomerase-like protein (cupin superfamily)